MQDLILTLGHFSLLFGLLAAAWATLGALLAVATGASDLQRSAERGVLVTAGMCLTAAGSLVYGFLTDDFRLDYVYHYSSTSQALPYKIGALWGGQAGSLLLWVSILAVMGSIMVWTNRTKNRTLMPHATGVVGLTLFFFMILLNFIESPFVTGPLRAEGVGLNPQLKNYWMMIHPPCLYLGYVGFTIPFAFGLAALATRRTGDIWFRTTRRWTLFSWFFLGTGILLGSYWAYIELGWGGYWAWDPVENASLMPWLTGTAFLHSVMIQEKKGMLKVWNVLLVILTFCLSIFGTFLTRSGVISSVHSFATSQIGPAFGTFLAVIFFGSMALLITRLPNLKSEGQLDSIVSRESSFLFNNMVLVGIAGTVLLLTTFPMFSEAITGHKVTMGPQIFNLVNIPWALVLLFLVGVGPLIAWRRASRENLRRSFLLPLLVGSWTLLALLALDARRYLEALAASGRALGALDVNALFDRVKAFYPALTFGLGAFVLATVVLELTRAARVRRHHGDGALLALASVVARNRRRWGGYIVHVGVVLVFFGIAASSAYQKEAVKLLSPGETLQVDDYWMRYDGFRLEAADDHFGAVTELTLLDPRSGKTIAALEAEQRMHPNLAFPQLRAAFEQARASQDPAAVAELYRLVRRLESQQGREVKTPSTEVGIHSSLSLLAPARFGEDFYVIPLGVDPGTGQANFRVFVNPMVNFIWLGGLVFVIGAHVAVLPDPRERKRLLAAMALEERAVA
ncbi:MAG TPA: heme lyase CcmF/NrfE family subunit [Candidatus Polarisedimenticolaceae bacterium]|nr:heme lyase CcmF/NrfE family subunit [Candidatus Polarisedimenticolaceae bacterium]